MTDKFLQFPVIDPVIFSIGPVSLRWYGTMYLIGFLAAMFMANKAADNSKGAWNRDQVSDLLFYGFLGAGGVYLFSSVLSIFTVRLSTVFLVSLILGPLASEI